MGQDIGIISGKRRPPLSQNGDPDKQPGQREAWALHPHLERMKWKDAWSFLTPRTTLVCLLIYKNSCAKDRCVCSHHVINIILQFMCACECKCVWVYIYMCVCECVYVHESVYTSMCVLYVCVWAWEYTCICLCVMFICINVYVSMCV